MVDDLELQPNGPPKQTKKFVESMRHRITLVGTAARAANSRSPMQPPAGTLALGCEEIGYALTHGVPRDSWERWLADNKNGPLVRNRIVFAANTAERAHDEARELRDLPHGLEPIDTTSSATIRKRLGGSPTRIETFDKDR